MFFGFQLTCSVSSTFFLFLSKDFSCDVPCWIFVSVIFQYLVIWYDINGKTKFRKPSKIFTFRNVHILLFILILLSLCNRTTQQVYNNPALFSIFESVFIIKLCLCGFLIFGVCTFFFYEIYKIYKNEEDDSPSLGKLKQFYKNMRLFYLIIIPPFIPISILGFYFVISGYINLPISIALEHLLSVGTHIFSWAALNFILWQFGFKKEIDDMVEKVATKLTQQ